VKNNAKNKKIELVVNKDPKVRTYFGEKLHDLKKIILAAIGF